MKIQLDTVNKTIKLESAEKMEKIVETLKKLFPNGEWKEFTLETNTTIVNWNRPVIIERNIHPAPYISDYPWYHSGDILCKAGSQSSTSYSLNAGTYNVEA